MGVDTAGELFGYKSPTVGNTVEVAIVLTDATGTKVAGVAFDAAGMAVSYRKEGAHAFAALPTFATENWAECGYGEYVIILRQSDATELALMDTEGTLTFYVVCDATAGDFAKIKVNPADVARDDVWTDGRAAQLDNLDAVGSGSVTAVSGLGGVLITNLVQEEDDYYKYLVCIPTTGNLVGQGRSVTGSENGGGGNTNLLFATPFTIPSGMGDDFLLWPAASLLAGDKMDLTDDAVDDASVESYAKFMADVSALALQATLTTVAGDVVNINGDAMRGTDNAALAAEWTAARAAVIDHIRAQAGDIWYVNGTTGNDANSGDSPEQAFLTIGAAFAADAAGDMIIVASGSYTEANLTMSTPNIKLVCEEGVILTGGGTGTCLNIRASDCVVTGVRLVPGAAHVGISTGFSGNSVRLENCVAEGCRIGFSITNTQLVVKNCQSIKHTETGFKITGSYSIYEHCQAQGAGAVRGFYLSAGCADGNVFNQCQSAGNTVAGYEVVAGANDNCFAFCASGGGDGTRVDNGTDTSWAGYAVLPLLTPGEEMDLVDAPNATAVTAIQLGLAVEATLDAIKGAGWTAETLKAIMAAINAIGPGTGANLFTATLNDDNGDPADGVVGVVRNVGGTLPRGVGTTNAGGTAGVIEFQLDDGDYELTFGPSANYSFANPYPFTVSGATPETFACTLLVIPTPSDPALCVCYADLRYVDGGQLIGADEGYLQVIAVTDDAHVWPPLAAQSALGVDDVRYQTDANGRAQFEAVRGAGVTVRVVRPWGYGAALHEEQVSFTVPDEDSYWIPGAHS